MQIIQGCGRHRRFVRYPAREKILPLMLGVQGVLGNLELDFQLGHQAFGAAAGNRIGNGQTRIGRRFVQSAHGQILCFQTIGNCLADLLIGIDTVLTGSQRIDCRRVAPETMKVCGVLLGRNAVLRFAITLLRCHHIHESGLIVSVGRYAAHRTIPNSVSYISDAAWIRRADALKAC